MAKVRNNGQLQLQTHPLRHPYDPSKNGQKIEHGEDTISGLYYQHDVVSQPNSTDTERQLIQKLPITYDDPHE